MLSIYSLWIADSPPNLLSVMEFVLDSFRMRSWRSCKITPKTNRTSQREIFFRAGTELLVTFIYTIDTSKPGVFWFSPFIVLIGQSCGHQKFRLEFIDSSYLCKDKGHDLWWDPQPSASTKFRKEHGRERCEIFTIKKSAWLECRLRLRLSYLFFSLLG